jgi:hypothetical protein
MAAPFLVHQPACRIGKVRKTLGEERYAQLINLAGQAKGLFADDSNDDNGKVDQGRAILCEIEKLIQAARSRASRPD